MLCERCKKNEANVHIAKIINGVKQELNLCEKCAKEMGNFNVHADMNLVSPFTFQNILSGIMDYISQPSEKGNNYTPVCKNCGTSYKEFREKGLVGCSECYKNLGSTLMPVIKSVQGNIQHVGKIPKKAGKDILDKKRILELKEELQKAITLEEYERAAEIRDKIKGIQNNN
ncbi:UvrB/UvrC motif-containing protein [Clostridium lundense]|uniref:UvrB/UvrC motif-containing protein n=1 Tax=Clostridium lundense TaxID=319475 RepID=UPI000486990C|nr:UvrB/UvrC motif-containing protein [Clostridium lundense]